MFGFGVLRWCDFFLHRVKKEGKNGLGKKEEKKEERKLQLASRGFQKTGSPQASTQRKPTQESQPTEAPNSATKGERENKTKDETEKTEGGSMEKEGRTNDRNHHRGKLGVQCHRFTHALGNSFFKVGSRKRKRRDRNK